jgi:hypothetical protein
MKLKLLFFYFLFFTGILQAQESILLNMPMDGDTINTKNPLLSWSLWGELPTNTVREYYQIILVELQENQDASAGILMNTPLLRVDHLAQNQLFYPYDAPELEEGKWYAWEIQKIVDNTLAFKSETYKFYIPILPTEEPVYYKLKVKDDGAIYDMQFGKFYFELDEDYFDDELNFQLYNPSNEKIQAQAIFNQEAGQFAQEVNVKRTGSNLYELTIGSNSALGIYKLVVQNAKKQKYQIKFEVK